MNDITALAQRMKATALKAKSEANEWGYDTDAFHDEATQDAVIALVEALEARDKQIAELVAGRLNLQRTMGVYVHAYEEAKSHISELEQRNNKLSDWGGRIEKLLKSTEESLIYSVDMVRELESRTVKLPLAVSVGGQGYREQVVSILTAAGIQVIEGEGHA